MSEQAPPRLSAVIFDMDGVLVDSERHWKQIEGYFLADLLPGWHVEDQSKVIGLSLHDIYTLLVRDYDLQTTKEEFVGMYHEMARQIYMEHVSLIEGFPEMLATLKGHSVPVALASSSPYLWIDMFMERFGLRGMFGVVVSADDLQGEGKPSPAIYLHTARLMGVRPEECLVIEDSKNGVLSATRAGMYCLGFRNGFNDEQDLSAAHEEYDSGPRIEQRVLELLGIE